MKCANLADHRKDNEKQPLAVYSKGPENHERAGNKQTDCKTENAAQAGPLNGANADKKTGVFQENGYHDAGSPASQAAVWFAENRDSCPRPIVPFLKRTFGLSALDAVLAIQAAKAGDK